MKDRDENIRHLDRDYTEPIRDPLWKHIYLSPGMMDVVASAPFQKLSRIKQLGVAHLVYPGATHTRFVHSLGVFYLAKRMIRVLLGAEYPPDLSPEGVKAFLCASLLHDIGHFPFTHSLKELPLRNHESLTAELILSSPLQEIISQKIGTEPWMAAAIVDESRSDRGISEIGFFRRILSGVLDPDKLDYLNRDAYYCGVPYGVQDTDFAIGRIHPHPERGIALDLTGLPAAENILFSKYLMYRAVYWHRTVRIATAMIKKAVFQALQEGVIVPDNLYGLDDEDFFRTVANNSFPPFALVRRVASRSLFKTVVEVPFDDERHGKLEALEDREKFEDETARRASRVSGIRLTAGDVLIDIPEKISFEIGLPVLHPEGRVVEYAAAGSVFTPPVVEGFTKTLRVLRVALPPDAAARIEKPRELLEDIL
jgi:HD superfamily phosphohydrolase